MQNSFIVLNPVVWSKTNDYSCQHGVVSIVRACYASSFVLHGVQDDSIFTGKSVWTAMEEESLLDAMDMYSFGNWYRFILYHSVQMSVC